MKIGKRKMSFLGFILWVMAVAVWFGGPFYKIHQEYYIEDPAAMYGMMGKLLLAMLVLAALAFLLYTAFTSPPGQFRNFFIAVTIVGLIGGSATAMEIMRSYTGGAIELLWNIAYIEVLGFGLNALSLFLDNHKYGDE